MNTCALIFGIEAFEACWCDLMVKHALNQQDKLTLVQSMGRYVDGYASLETLKGDLPKALRPIWGELIKAYEQGYCSPPDRQARKAPPAQQKMPVKSTDLSPEAAIARLKELARSAQKKDTRRGRMSYLEELAAADTLIIEDPQVPED